MLILPMDAMPVPRPTPKRRSFLIVILLGRVAQPITRISTPEGRPVQALLGRGFS
jgi:hypothetical protein